MYDQFSNDITVGSFITYPVYRSGKMLMRTAKVLQTNKNDGKVKVRADVEGRFRTVTLKRAHLATIVHPAQVEMGGHDLEDFEV